jgi:hypothetical protein
MDAKWWWSVVVAAGMVLAPAAWAQDDEVAEDEEVAEEEEYAEAPEPIAMEAGKWKPILELDAQVFPSLIISTAHSRPADDGEEPDPTVLGDPEGLLGIAVGNPKPGAKIRVEIRSDTIMLPSVYEGVMDEADTTYFVFPKINYKYDVLHKVIQQTPVNITFDVSIDGKAQPQRVETASLRSINDCPFVALDDYTGEVLDLSWMFAAYVNENHPQIDEILSEALDNRTVNAFTGYQSGDADEVFMQVYAIWNVMQLRGFRYSSITETPGVSPKVYSQHVRFMDEALKTSQANCVDGSALFASVLRKIGLNVYLVIVPGHCFLAFDLDREGTAIIGLETTMMGSENLGDYDAIEDIDEDEAAELKDEASYQSFSAAVDVGTQALADNAEKFDDVNETQYLLIAVEPARQMGIMPIGRAN